MFRRIHIGGIGHATSDFLPRSAPGEEIRADGDCVCSHCGKAYRRHPHDPYRGFLNVLCDGTRVKL